MENHYLFTRSEEERMKKIEEFCQSIYMWTNLKKPNRTHSVDIISDILTGEDHTPLQTSLVV